MVLTAWSRSRRPEAADRVEALGSELQQQQQQSANAAANNCNLQMDAVTYMARINVWERSGHLPRTSARKAAGVLQEMVQAAAAAAAAGNNDLHPTTLHFNRVLIAWTAAGDVLEAEALLERMLSHFLKGQTAAAPNLSSFNFVLAAWSKKSSREAAAQAEQWLDRMEEYAESFGLPVRPDAVSFNTVLGSWARSGSDVAWERALALKRRMQERHKLRPDMYTYGSLLQILAKSEESRQNVAANAKMILGEMQDAGVEPNSFILRLVAQCTQK